RVRAEHSYEEMGMSRVVMFLSIIVLTMPVHFLARAATIDLDLQMMSGTTAGVVPVDMQIGSGRISAIGVHDGFQIWINAVKSGEQANRYIIYGKNSGHPLRVWIGGDGWANNMESGNGIIINDSREEAVFKVYLDGEQSVATDSYSFVLTGGAFKK
ncbi:MAG: AfaD family invasin, partial [Aeromonas allosaccharophila]